MCEEDRESNFHHCGSPVRLVQTCLCAGNADNSVLTRYCEARADLFKCLRRLRKQFSPLWKACGVGSSLFMCVNDLRTPFLTAERVL